MSVIIFEFKCYQIISILRSLAAIGNLELYIAWLWPLRERWGSGIDKALLLLQHAEQMHIKKNTFSNLNEKQVLYYTQLSIASLLIDQNAQNLLVDNYFTSFQFQKKWEKPDISNRLHSGFVIGFRLEFMSEFRNIGSRLIQSHSWDSMMICILSPFLIKSIQN